MNSTLDYLRKLNQYLNNDNNTTSTYLEELRKNSPVSYDILTNGSQSRESYDPKEYFDRKAAAHRRSKGLSGEEAAQKNETAEETIVRLLTCLKIDNELNNATQLDILKALNKNNDHLETIVSLLRNSL